MDFGEAIRALKDGKRVARAGWNGRLMHLELVSPYARPDDASRGSKYFVKRDVTDLVPPPPSLSVPEGAEVTVGDVLYGERIVCTLAPPFVAEAPDATKLLPFIGMKTADNCFVPWLASQTDMLAEDWSVVS